MKIVIFGSEKCKFCKKQVGFVKNSFDETDWMYLDVSKDKGMLKIASETNVKNIPTTIVFDDDWNPIFVKEGTFSSESIFYAIHGDTNIPIGQKTEDLILSGKITSCIVSGKRVFSSGEKVDLVRYSNKKITTAKILSADKMSQKAIEKICHPSIIQEYIESGGRMDWAQFLVLGL